MSIMKERFKGIESSFSMKPLIKFDEYSQGLKGELLLKAYDMAQDGKLVYSYQHKNIIVNVASILIARLLKNNTEPQNGISYLAIGSGSGEWEPFDPPAPTTSQTRLENEFYRKAIDFTTFVHPESGEPTSIYTNIVDYSVTLGEGEAVGPILELGLFGGDATIELNSGTMINWRTFPVVYKTSTMSLTIIFRITS